MVPKQDGAARSPAFPQYTLKSLRTPLEKISNKCGSSKFSTEEIYRVWGVSPSSYSARSRLGALRTYGLVIPDSHSHSRDHCRVPMRGRMFLAYAPGLHGRSVGDDAAKDAAMAPAVFQHIWDSYQDRVERCRTEADFRRVGNDIAYHLVNEADPRYSEKGAGKLVAVFLQNTVYVRLIPGVDTVPYDGPFVPTAKSEKPIMRLAPDSRGGVVFELRIRERVTRESLKEVLELVTAVTPFIEKREKRDEE